MKIQDILKNIPYYFDNGYSNYKTFEDFPIIDKTIVKKEGLNFCDKIYTGPLLSTQTSGSTGDIFTVKWKPQDYYRSVSHTWRNRAKYGISVIDNYGTNHAFSLDNMEYPLNHKIFLYKNRISISKMYMDDESLWVYIRALTDFAPKWLSLQPTFAYRLAMFCKRNKVLLSSVKLIELSGEMLPNNVRQYITEAFNIPVINHYGMQEFNTIAYEVPDNQLLVERKNVFVEIIDDYGNRCNDKEEGHIIVTSLNNTFMPLVRYKTFDMGYMCTVNNKKYLTITHARTNQELVIEKRSFDQSIFFYLTDKINTYDFQISSFQYIKIGKNLKCVFKADNPINNLHLSSLISDLLCDLFDIHFEDIEISTDEKDFLKGSGNKNQYFFDLSSYEN